MKLFLSIMCLGAMLPISASSAIVITSGSFSSSAVGGNWTDSLSMKGINLALSGTIGGQAPLSTPYPGSSECRSGPTCTINLTSSLSYQSTNSLYPFVQSLQYNGVDYPLNRTFGPGYDLTLTVNFFTSPVTIPITTTTDSSGNREALSGFAGVPLTFSGTIRLQYSQISGLGLVTSDVFSDTFSGTGSASGFIERNTLRADGEQIAFAFSSVPEPAPLAMIAAGLAVLAGRRRVVS